MIQRLKVTGPRYSNAGFLILGATMRYPNKRYGNPEAMRHYAMWYGTVKNLAQALRRSERSVRDWLSGAARVPFWVPELMRLQQMEHNNTAYQITGRQVAARLGTVAAGVVVDAGARFLAEPPPLAAPEIAAVKKAHG